MDSRKRELDALSEQEQKLQTELENVKAKRARLHVECYGPFSFFSMLPLEIIFLILEHVFKVHVREGLPACDSYNFLLTCRDAYQLSGAWATHLFSRLGGIRHEWAPSLPTLCHKLDSLKSEGRKGRNQCFKLLCLGIDPYMMEERGFYHTPCLVISWFSLNLQLLNSKFVCPEFTRVLLRFTGLNPLSCAVFYGLVDTIPWDEWLGRVKQERFADLVDWDFGWYDSLWQKTLISLVDCAARWRSIFVKTLQKGMFKLMAQLFPLVQEGWVSFWESLWQFVHTKPDTTEKLLETIIDFAPEFMLRLPGVEGGSIDTSLLFLERMIVVTVWRDYEHFQKGKSRLVGLVTLDKTYKVSLGHFANPESAILFEEHMGRLGARVEWK